MGKKDRERYEKTGMVFRDGHLVNKEEWEREHPKKSQIVQQKEEEKKKVKAAVTAELESRFETPYHCSKCNRTHKVGSKIHHSHLQYKE